MELRILAHELGLYAFELLRLLIPKRYGFTEFRIVFGEREFPVESGLLESDGMRHIARKLAPLTGLRDGDTGKESRHAERGRRQDTGNPRASLPRSLQRRYSLLVHGNGCILFRILRTTETAEERLHPVSHRTSERTAGPREPATALMLVDIASCRRGSRSPPRGKAREFRIDGRIFGHTKKGYG